MLGAILSAEHYYMQCLHIPMYFADACPKDTMKDGFFFAKMVFTFSFRNLMQVNIAILICGPQPKIIFPWKYMYACISKVDCEIKWCLDKLHSSILYSLNLPKLLRGWETLNIWSSPFFTPPTFWPDSHKS